MAEVHVTKQVATPPDELWQRIGDFHGLHKWAQGVQPTEAIDDGRARKFDIGETPLIEELVEEGERSYTYQINEPGPLPVENYRATLKVSPDAGGSLINWDATFDPRGVSEDQAVAIMTGVFESGLSGL